MDLGLNDAQLLVLQWVANGADLENPPSDAFKTSAVALHNRDLVVLDKRRGKWSIAITEAGQFYLQHGHHPKEKAAEPTLPSSSKPAQDAPTPSKPEVAIAREPGHEVSAPENSERVIKDETIPIPEQVRRPHKAVKELVDHKARLAVPIDHRQRALLILHALAQEALRRGWKVIPNPSSFEVDRWNGRRKRVSPGPDLFSIDAGDAPVVIRLRMQQKRVPSVPTEAELAEKAKWSWTRIPTHDYLPTERMRLEIRPSSSDVTHLDDTVATRIEDKLLRRASSTRNAV